MLETFMITPLVRLAIAGSLALGLAFAQAPAAQKVKKAHPKLQHRLIKQLSLTTTQKQQAKDIFKQAKTSNQSVRTELKQNQDSMTVAIKSNNVAQIDQLAQTRANLRAKVTTARSEAMAKFYASLTPDQKTKADQIQQKLEKRAARIKG
jgi:Spy/CpxP family protein refolding chaperone